VLRTEDAFDTTFALERSSRPPLGRLLDLAQVAEAYPREFLFYSPGVPSRVQLAALRALARLGGRPGRAANRFLGIYMNDQLALGLVFREVARRAAGENAGTPLGDALAEVSTEIAEDIATFEQLMERLGLHRSRAKARLAIAVKRLGRIKPNGRVLAYSPLSRFAELDFLVMGIEGKKILWPNLADLADLRARLPDVDFDALIERANSQRAVLEPFRARAGRSALATSPAKNT